MLKPDFDRTVTGYFWLDRLLDPILTRYYNWQAERTRARIFDRIGNGDRDLGETIFNEAVREAVDG